MALEAGSAMHEVFAAVRCWQLETVQKLPAHALYTGERLFGRERWADAKRDSQKAGTDARDRLIALAFSILHSGPFYDDPYDNIRTLANMELTAIRYCDDRMPVMPSWPIYVADLRRPDSLVGIEQVFDVVLVYADGKRLRYIGTIDGLTAPVHKAPRLFIDENKTASRLDEGWRRSFEMVNQITGYCAASTTVYGREVLNARIHGVKIKQSSSGENSYVFEVERTVDSIAKWGAWLRFTVEMREAYTGVTHNGQFIAYDKPDFENSPRFTHSCNRYFRPCSLITFCADTPEGRAEAWDEMVPVEPSPSEQAVMEQF